LAFSFRPEGSFIDADAAEPDFFPRGGTQVTAALLPPPRPDRMSDALLPQPGGFEGLGLGEEAQKPSRLAILPLDHATEGRLGLGSACLATGAEPTDRDDSIAEVTNLREFQADLGERLVDVTNPLADASCPRYTVASLSSNA
jgi:hypothetical protein